MPVLSLAIPDLGRNLDPQILITLDTEGPWNLKVPKGKVDFAVSGSTEGYYVKNATLTDLGSQWFRCVLGLHRLLRRHCADRHITHTRPAK